MSTSPTMNMRSSTELLEHALGYARAGLSVLPLTERDKVPLIQGGVHSATTGFAVIRGWWQRWPQANIGLAIPPGLLVLDIDSADALQHLHVEGLDLPATVRATTGRGLHLWYSTGLFQARNRVALLPGIDVRAPGGYVVAPPSIHPSGAVYRWEVELRRSFIAPCPDWLLEKLKQGVGPTQGRSADDWAAKVKEVVPQGCRNQTFAEVAGLLFRRLPAEAAAELAWCWAAVKLKPPLPEIEIRRTLESIAGRELRRRGLSP